VINFTFRIPDDLYAKLKDLATSEDRSINSELLFLVRRAVDEDERRSDQGA
jgi:hypothetical protein